MEYNILERRQDITIRTEVLMTFDVDGVKHERTVDIPHFNPQNETEIVRGIENRYKSEFQNLIKELHDQR